PILARRREQDVGARPRDSPPAAVVLPDHARALDRGLLRRLHAALGPVPGGSRGGAAPGVRLCFRARALRALSSSAPVISLPFSCADGRAEADGRPNDTDDGRPSGT